MLIFQYLQGKLHEIPISRMFINRFTIVYKLREKHIQQVLQGKNNK